MTRKLWTAALVAAIGLALPVTGRSAATDDANDTITEHGHNAKKTARSVKPGGETASDRKEDAKDTGAAMQAKTKKKMRHAKKTTHDTVHDATK